MASDLLRHFYQVKDLEKPNESCFFTKENSTGGSLLNLVLSGVRLWLIATIAAPLYVSGGEWRSRRFRLVSPELKTTPPHPCTSVFTCPSRTRGFVYTANPRPALIAVTADVARVRRVILPTVLQANPDKAEPSPPFIAPLLIFSPALTAFLPRLTVKLQESLSPGPRHPRCLRLLETFHDMPAETATGG